MGTNAHQEQAASAYSPQLVPSMRQSIRHVPSCVSYSACVLIGAALCGQATILSNLKDPDVSIRRRALDLLFTMCDGGAAVEVVEQLVSVPVSCKPA